LSRVAATAAKLLARFGEEVSIAFPNQQARDPITGELMGDSAPPLIVSGNGYAGRYKASDIGGPIQAGDIRLVLELIDPRPIPGCLAQVDGNSYRVIETMTVRSSGADIVYICQLRRQ
jgi:hypothetical protein